MAYVNRLNRFQSTLSPATSNPSMNTSSHESTPTPVNEKSGILSTDTEAAQRKINLNIEYLKNCILKYMTTNNISEKQRLYKVIATILNFTSKEIKSIEETIQEEINNNPGDQIQSAISTISSWFGSTTNAPPPPSKSSSVSLTMNSTGELSKE